MGPTCILILADGDWGDADAVRALRHAAEVCVATDGAWAKARSAGVPVDVVIGDFDSLSVAQRAELNASGARVIPFPEAKDWTDLELAIDHALRMRPACIVVYGALGGRTDHAMTNLHLLEKGLEAGVPMECVTATETIRLIDGDLVLAGARIGDSVSLVPITESVRLSTEGLEYELRDERLRRAASRGVSNAVRSLPARIAVAEGRLLVVRAGGFGGGAT
jgi:thiamine pyrophosphokinase